MSRLIIVAGASGAGKTFMLSELSKYRNDIVPIKSTLPEDLERMKQKMKLSTYI